MTRVSRGLALTAATGLLAFGFGALPAAANGFSDSGFGFGSGNGMPGIGIADKMMSGMGGGTFGTGIAQQFMGGGTSWSGGNQFSSSSRSLDAGQFLSGGGKALEGDDKLLNGLINVGDLCGVGLIPILSGNTTIHCASGSGKRGFSGGLINVGDLCGVGVVPILSSDTTIHCGKPAKPASPKPNAKPKPKPAPTPVVKEKPEEPAKEVVRQSSGKSTLAETGAAAGAIAAFAAGATGLGLALRRRFRGQD